MADKIVQEIEVVAKVDEAMRKVDKLEQAFDKAMDSIKQDTKEATNQTEKLTGRFGKLQGAMSKLGGVAKRVFVGGAIIAGLKRGIELADDFHRSTGRLTASLAQVGRSQDLDALQGFASELERVTGVSDEVHRDLIALALQLGFTRDRAVDATIAAIGMANAMGSNADEAMKQLAKTQTGLLEETIRMVGPIRELTKEELKLGKAIDVAKNEFEGFVGATSAQSGTVARGMTEMGNGLDNMLESFGRGLDELGLGTVLNKIGQTMTLIGVAAEKVFLRLRISFKTVTEGLPAAMAGFIFGEEGDAGRFFQETLRPEFKRLKALIAAETEAENILFGDVPDALRRPDLGMDPAKAAKDAADKAAKDKAQKDRLARIKKEKEEEKEFWAYYEELNFKARLEQQKEQDKKLADQKKSDWLKSHLDMFEKQRESLAEVQRINKEHQDKVNAILKTGMNTALGVFGNFAETSIEALFLMRDGQKGAFKEMMKNFLEHTGNQLIGRGISDSLQGAAMLATGQPQGAALMGIGAAELAAGALMRGGSLMIKTPDTSAAKTAGVGSTPAATSGGGMQQGNGQPTATTINIFGAMTTEESALLIQRGMRQAEARGFA